jgi:hypothetical protein
MRTLRHTITAYSYMNMKKSQPMKKIFLLIPLSILCWSCATESPIVPDNSREVEIKFTASDVLTRGSIAAERTIHTVDILVFDGEGLSTDNAKFLYTSHAWEREEDLYRAVLKVIDKDLDVYFAINARNVILAAGLTADMTWSTVRQLLVLQNPDQIDLVRNGLPMWGYEYDIALSANNTYEFGQNSEGRVRLFRAVASTDVEVTADNFTLSKGHIVYGADKGLLAFDPGKITEKTGGQFVFTDPVVPNGMTTNKEWAKSTTSANSVQNVLYFYENDTPVGGHKETKVVLEGKWSGSTKSNNTFYPLAFRNMVTEAKMDVIRNRKFVIVITNVNGDGYDSLDDAKDAEAMNIVYEVVPWEEWNDEIRVGNQYLSLGRDRNADRSRAAVLYRNATSTDRIQFETNVPLGDIEMTLTENPTEEDFENDGSVENEFFKVDIQTDSEGVTWFVFTALKDYEAGETPEEANPSVLSVQVGLINIQIDVWQQDASQKDWNDGPNKDQPLQGL